MVCVELALAGVTGHTAVQPALFNRLGLVAFHCCLAATEHLDVSLTELVEVTVKEVLGEEEEEEEW